MTEPKRVLLVGWNPDSVDYSKHPDLTAEKVRDALETDRSQLVSSGYDAQWCFLSSMEAGERELYEALDGQFFDCVLIGAGVRLDPETTVLFSRLVNLVHVLAPEALFSFNSNPSDTAQSVQRCLPIDRD